MRIRVWLCVDVAVKAALILLLLFGAFSGLERFETFIRNSAELDTAYTETLGDLALGLSGSVAAALLTARIMPRVARDEG